MPEFPYLFVSYASADRGRVLPIVDRLEQAGVKAWIDREGIHGGTNYAEVIGEAIKGAAALVLMASPASLASRNVRQELALAWRYERPYLPLLLEPGDIPDNLAYWLEGSQWIEVLDHPEQVWLADLAQALQHVGITLQMPTTSQTFQTASRERPLLVGREREQGVLRQQLDRMLAGRGGVVLIGGEAGIGKTTLVEDLSVQAEEQGGLVLWGHAYDLSVTPPYGPWLEILRRYRSVRGDYWPPVPDFVGDAEALAQVGSQETLFAAVADFFTAVAVQRPLVLVLDDLHWVDQASLDFFRFLARQVATCRLLLVATYRSDELHRRHPLYSLLPLLIREAVAERLEVRPLDVAGHRALIQSRYVLSEGDQLRLERYLDEHAEGNPLYAGELLRTLEEASVLTAHDGGWVLGDLARVRVPPLLRQVIEGRLARLNDETRRLLQLAAVIGQEVPLELWQQVSGASDEAVEAAIEQGQGAQLIEENSLSSYRFRHALLREALYEEIIALRRRIWHRQIAEARAQLPTPDPDLVAYHFQQADDPRAVEWLLQAAERASRAFAGRAAAERLEAVLAIYQEQGRDPQSYYGLLFAIGTLRRYASNTETIAYLIEAASAAREAGDLILAAIADAQRGFVRVMLGDIREGLGVLQQAVDEALRLLPEDPDILDRPIKPSISLAGDESLQGILAARITIRVHFLAVVGRLQEALDLAAPVAETIHQAIEDGEPLPLHLWDGAVPYQVDNLIFGLVVAYATLGQIELARQFFSAAERCFEATRNPYVTVEVLFEALNMYFLPFGTDKPAELAAVGQAAMAALQQALGVLPEGSVNPWPKLPVLVLAGHWQEADALAWEARGRASSAFAEQFNLTTIVPVLRHQGRHDDAWQEIRSLLPDGPQTEPGNVPLLVALRLQRVAAGLALDAHDLPTTRTWVDAHDRWLDWSGAVLGRAEGALLWACYHHATGDPTQARVSAQEALAHANDPRQPLALIAAHRFLGLLDTEQGQFDGAEEHLGQSLDLAQACAAPFERALTLLGLAELRMRQDNPDEARTLLDDVWAICEPLGAKPTLERVDRLRERLVEAPPA